VNCIIMAGGKGTRFGSPAKFLSKVCGESIVERLLKQLESVCCHIMLALSKYTIMNVKNICGNYEVDCLESSGEDYVKDLATILSAYIKPPVLVLAADIVIKNSEILVKFVEKAMTEPVEVVTAVINRSGGVEPLGLSLFKSSGGSWRNIALSPSLVTDVDSVNDLRLAEKVCESV